MPHSNLFPKQSTPVTRTFSGQPQGITDRGVVPQTMYVGNLSGYVTHQDLQDLFSKYGQVSQIYMPSDRETGRPRGYAYVDMSDSSQEARAIEATDGMAYMGREMRVTFAKLRMRWGNGRF